MWKSCKRPHKKTSFNNKTTSSELVFRHLHYHGVYSASPQSLGRLNGWFAFNRTLYYIPITPTTTTLSSGRLFPTHTHHLALIICDSIRLPTTCSHCFFSVGFLASIAGRLVKKREAKLFSRGLLFWKTGRITLNGWLFQRFAFDSIRNETVFLSLLDWWFLFSWLAGWFFASLSGVKDEEVLRFPCEFFSVGVMQFFMLPQLPTCHHHKQVERFEKGGFFFQYWISCAFEKWFDLNDFYCL